jgi:6-phosphogluconolactonase
MKRVAVDERRTVLVAKTEDEAYDYFLQTFAEEAKRAVSARATFSVALSGGNTPLPFYERLKDPSVSLMINWSLLNLFWGDERCVPINDPECNWTNALPFFTIPPLDQAHKHRLIGDSTDHDKAARAYEAEVHHICPQDKFDLVLLGIGEDGHTASLFPNTEALNEKKRLYVANFIPQKNLWRLTITYPAIDNARAVWVLAFGRPKAKALKRILFGPTTTEETPAWRLGTKETPVTYLIDRKAAYGLGL